MSISLVDIGWAAGFLEGEGWFGEGRSPKIGAGQKDKEPLERLQKLFGGKIIIRSPIKGAFGKSSLYWWVLDAYRSPQVMMTLYSLMSERRKTKIGEILSLWKNAKNMRKPGSNICYRGHLIEGYNKRVVPAGYSRCRICQEIARRAARARRQGELIKA